jgi:hypothetical protein
MANATPQTQAVQIANQLMAISTQMIQLWQQMVALDAAWTDQGVAATLAAMGTVALNTDGTAGAADGTPNAAHPLDPAKYPALAHLLSSNQIVSIKSILDNGIVNYINGQAVSTQVGARAILNAATGG